MGRWTEEDPAPPGMTRIGYDSDTQCYIFRDADGSIYEGEVSGGNLRLVSRPGQKTEQDDEPLRLMPGRPAQPSQSPVESTTSPTFQDMLPSHMIVSASSSKSSPSPGKHSAARSEDPSTSGSVLARIRSTPHGSPQKLSIWKSIRRATRSSRGVPSTPRLAGVVQSATQRSPPGKLRTSAGYEQLIDSRSDDSHSSRPLPPMPSSKGKQRE